MRDAEAGAGDASTATLTDVFEALAHPVRLDVVRQLALRGELACSQIDVDLASSTMSRHYRVLREAGLVTVRHEGVYRYLRLRTESISQMYPGLLELVTGS